MHELSRSDHLWWVEPSHITFFQLFISAQSTEVWFMMPYLSYSRVECACWRPDIWLGSFPAGTLLQGTLVYPPGPAVFILACAFLQVKRLWGGSPECSPCPCPPRCPTTAPAPRPSAPARGNSAWTKGTRSLTVKTTTFPKWVGCSIRTCKCLTFITSASQSLVLSSSSLCVLKSFRA